MSEQVVTLPWPSKGLSPNARLHWAALSKAKKSYRLACFALTREAKLQAPANGPIRIDMEFHRPTRRSYDSDNLISSMKSGLDGVADAMGVNDKRFVIYPPVIAETVGGFVRVKVSAA